jgi:glycogen phosphorylase
MEIGIDERICTYSGGLGVRAGDTIRSAADLRVPMAAVTFLYRKGYFRQRLEADGRQREEPTSWAFAGSGPDAQMGGGEL